MASWRPAPVLPGVGQTFLYVGSLPFAAFHFPHTLVSGIGVGATLPHCQSPPVSFRFAVMSVTKIEGSNGRQQGSHPGVVELLDEQFGTQVLGQAPPVLGLLALQP